MSLKIEIGHGSQYYGYVESDGDALYCSGPRREVLQLFVKEALRPDDDNADSVLKDLPRRLQGRLWTRAIEHLAGQHDQSTHGNKYGMTKAGKKVLLPRKSKSVAKNFSSSEWDGMSTEEREEYLQGNGGYEWEDSLTQGEKNAIKAYSGHDYTEMNDVLRNGEDSYPHQEQLEKQIKNATSGLMKGEAPSDMTVVRGIRAEQFEHFDGAEGLIFHEKGFCSTTIKPEGAGFAEGGVRLHINVPKGTPGAYIKSMSQYAHEHEWLLPPGAKFRIDKVNSDDWSKEVHLTYLGVS